jgi:hypothetical protein
MNDIRKIINLLQEDISEDWFKTGAFQAYKDSSAPEPFVIATEPGELHHREGKGKTQKYDKGFYILTDPQGGKYSMPPETFNELKTDNGDGTATPKAIVKLAKVADHSGSVKTSWGETLHYDPEVDVIVRHGPGDYGVVKADTFKQTYKRV